MNKWWDYIVTCMEWTGAELCIFEACGRVVETYRCIYAAAIWSLPHSGISVDIKCLTLSSMERIVRITDNLIEIDIYPSTSELFNNIKNFLEAVIFRCECGYIYCSCPVPSDCNCPIVSYRLSRPVRISTFQ